MNKMQAVLHRRCKSFPSIHHSATGRHSNPRRWSAIKRRGLLAVSGDRREETVSRLHPAAARDTRDERPARFVTSAHNAARLTPTRQVATGRRNMERAGGKESAESLRCEMETERKGGKRWWWGGGGIKSFFKMDIRPRVCALL